VLGTSTRSRSRPKFFSWSRPKKYIRSRSKHGRDRNLDDNVEIFWIATRSKILDCFHQAVCPGKFSEIFNRSRAATGIYVRNLREFIYPKRNIYETFMIWYESILHERFLNVTIWGIFFTIGQI
jgi:hypothetical protein